ncbi:MULTISPECIES: GTP 3',8-cyclase MoaA [Paenarthrobacter]|uniref:GTP 3',8-cyclase n=1 Tax=Paenarthrobacter ureafaciens TaxID=37931 RepID=A0AAX3EN05_PAEUR|nr:MULTISPECIES: GTP 3',8-cyclase MoaA [Paenarthrobacter]NKR13548.1 cyclic pyranopterin phosphate synthase [Arthrobacter sp. M5]NKR15465.1 cyclic pyranopterin phosphate synthase [Arthrobacter sp. M6]OEH59326.1 cyclic pyranopterin phosphate synthase [Arthrobacter sp. D2]OEH60691.1 cyclic pyranopterin phosphate synthase [Arthrobacter sp. D4]MDO5864388.1 GTP 3',8-cyclase MoaA [Paenarthrobacter sp. SD-2]
MKQSTRRAVALGIPLVPSNRATAGTRGVDERPDSPALVDTYRRTARDLRVSLTDRCNLRCQYCMPAEGLEWAPGSLQLSDEEVIRLVGVAVGQLGVREVRFTGGEPLLRKGLEKIVAATASLRTDEGKPPSMSLTTNGLGLAHRALGLAKAGLARVNVSLDSIDRATYATITRRDRLPEVLSGIRAAAEAGMAPIKLNAVLIRGLNHDQAIELLSYALDNGYELRFIEQMPLGPHDAWNREQMVSADEILSILQKRYALVRTSPGDRGSAPAETWDVLDGNTERILGTVGIISAVTQNFCGACDRTRLTADGQVRTCLFATSEHDLRTPMRSGATDDELAHIWRTAHWGKLAGHGIDDPSFLQPERLMSAIGG